MGFGTVFVGYFLLLNIGYYGFTDIIAALIMMLGLYKLSGINRPFYLGFIASGVFSVFALWELVFRAAEMLGFNLLSSSLAFFIPVVRYVILSALTALILLGIVEVAREVELMKTAARARASIYLTFALYLTCLLLETPIAKLFPTALIAIFVFISVFGTAALIIFNLTIIFSCYKEICMPDEKIDSEPRESKFKFVNDFRRHQAEKQMEYAKYRLEKKKKQSEKRNKKK
jgi:hypothetical protein